MPPGGAGAESGVGAALPLPQPELLPASQPSRRAVAGLLQQYGPLNSLLLNSPGFSSSELAQLMAACIALQGSQLADRLPLQQNDAFRLGSALALVFGAGLASLRWQATSAAADHTALLDMLLNCSHQLAAAAKALQCAAHPKRQPQAAAAFVRTAGRPDAVLPWLLAASQALLAVPPDVEGTVCDKVNGTRAPAKGGQRAAAGSVTQWFLAAVGLQGWIFPLMVSSGPCTIRHVC